MRVAATPAKLETSPFQEMLLLGMLFQLVQTRRHFGTFRNAAMKGHFRHCNRFDRRDYAAAKVVRIKCHSIPEVGVRSAALLPKGERTVQQHQTVRTNVLRKRVVGRELQLGAVNQHQINRLLVALGNGIDRHPLELVAARTGSAVRVHREAIFSLNNFF
uniref:(northern house mosquito) hypothetical protein n=1 Tax=Culex pipiens TaxID=7175 RepID=A0A8D8PCI2_CULPI